MDIKKTKKEMLEEKEKMLARYTITQDYLIYRISLGEEDRRDDLNAVQHRIDELEKIIEFLKK